MVLESCYDSHCNPAMNKSTSHFYTDKGPPSTGKGGNEARELSGGISHKTRCSRHAVPGSEGFWELVTLSPQRLEADQKLTM